MDPVAGSTYRGVHCVWPAGYLREPGGVMDESTKQARCEGVLEAIELLALLRENLFYSCPVHAMDLISKLAIFAPPRERDQYIAWAEALNKLESAEMYLREGVLEGKA